MGASGNCGGRDGRRGAGPETTSGDPLEILNEHGIPLLFLAPSLKQEWLRNSGAILEYRCRELTIAKSSAGSVLGKEAIPSARVQVHVPSIYQAARLTSTPSQGLLEDMERLPFLKEHQINGQRNEEKECQISPYFKQGGGGEVLEELLP